MNRIRIGPCMTFRARIIEI